MKRTCLKKNFFALCLLILTLPSFLISGAGAVGSSRIFSSYSPDAMFPGYSSCSRSADLIAASQLSSGVLSSISTDELIEVVLHTPKISDVFFADDCLYGKALDELSELFNTLAELNSRSDSAEILLEKYCSLDLSKANASKSAYGFTDYYRVVLLELLLGRNAHFDRLTEKQKAVLLAAVLEKADEKESTGICISYKDAFFLNVDSSASKYYESVIGLYIGGEKTQSVYVYTSGGQHLSAEQWDPDNDHDFGELSNDITVSEVIQNLTSAYPAVSMVGNPTRKYNCHSYAWHNPSQSNTYWINYISAYVSDVNTQQVYSAASADIIVYKDSSGNITHSGLTDGYSNGKLMVVSKWGEGWLCRHEYDDVPAIYGTSYAYYTYIRPHTHSYPLSWTYYSPATHRRYCTLCNVFQSQAHVLNAAQTLCTVCGGTGPFVINKSAGICYVY